MWHLHESLRTSTTKSIAAKACAMHSAPRRAGLLSNTGYQLAGSDYGKEPLTCWDAQLNGKMRIEFEGKSSQKFYIQRSQDEKNVAEFTFEVAWVYDASTHRDNGSHWRIF
jgi:hypothetical protein